MSSWPLRGRPGARTLQWDYWNGAAWANLEGSFSDGTQNLLNDGALYWPDDPPGWAPIPVAASAPFYYVRACLAVGAYATPPSRPRSPGST